MIECYIYINGKYTYVSVFIFRVEVDVTKIFVCINIATCWCYHCFKRILINVCFGELDWPLQDSWLKYRSFILIPFFFQIRESLLWKVRTWFVNTQQQSSASFVIWLQGFYSACHCGYKITKFPFLLIL